MKGNMQPVKPVMVIDLFPQERKQLLELFSEFEPERRISYGGHRDPSLTMTPLRSARNDCLYSMTLIGS